MSILLGAIADDFTGATDLANTLVRNGMRTVQTIGVPPVTIDLGDADAVVVALKTRTVAVGEAISASLAALSWLSTLHPRQLFFKYCSTFDSTPAGNIGPVADVLMGALDCSTAVVCPAFPGAGRTIYQGHLFVGEQLLSESTMKNHPLTPMTDSSLLRLMGAQSQKRVGLVPLGIVDEGPLAITARINQLHDSGCGYVVTDVVAERHLRDIGTAIADHKLVTGGSGIAMGLPDNFRKSGLLGPPVEPALPSAAAGELVIAGSCSKATREQVAYAERHWPCRKLDPDRVAADEPVVDEITSWAANQPADAPIVIYSSADPDEVAAVQSRHGRDNAGALIEKALADIAAAIVAGGRRRVIVAGGETAGAVVSRLGVTGLAIGREIDPGVPWTETLGEPRLALALKSGNFGAVNFFEKAFGMLQ